MEKTTVRRCVHCMGDVSGGRGDFCPHCGKPWARAEQPGYCLRPLTVLQGKYLVGRMLGRGGFGITYIGFDLNLEMRVAIKECFPAGLASRDAGVSNTLQWDTSLREGDRWRESCASFLREARKMAKVQDIPEVVRVQDTFEENNTAYIVMEYVEGVTLKSWVDANGAMEPERCVAFLRPLMEALVEVHARGLIHRDISPDNIMILKKGRPRLLDLGAAKELANVAVNHSRLVTKNGFSPPEQYSETGKIGPWTDVYALCATLYYCMTGRMPEDAIARLTGDAEVDFDPSLFRGELPERIRSALRDGLALKVDGRTPTVGSLTKRLESPSGPEREPGPGPELTRTLKETVEEPGETREPEWGFTNAAFPRTPDREIVRSVERAMDTQEPPAEPDWGYTGAAFPRPDAKPGPEPAKPVGLPPEGERKYAAIPPTEPVKKRSNKKLLIVLGALAAILAVALIALLPRGGDSHSGREDSGREDGGGGTVTPPADSDQLFIPGTYQATERGMASDVEVTMTFDGSRITDVEIDVSGETPDIGGRIGDTMAQSILTAQSAEVDAVSGATVTSDAVMAAAAACIDQASVGDADSGDADIGGKPALSAADFPHATVAAGSMHTVALKSDGTVVAVGSNNIGQCDVSEWRDIVEVAAWLVHTVGLRSDGTVAAVGRNEHGECDVGSWSDIVQIAAGDHHTVGLKSDGTVAAVGDNEDGQCDVSDWRDIVQIAAGRDHTVGLRSDGTVVAVGRNNDGQCDVSGWSDIVLVACGGNHTLGLKSDGTVVAVGYNVFGQCDVSGWSGMVQVSGADWNSVGVKRDGTCAFTGNTESIPLEIDVSDWSDIVFTACGLYHAVGLRSDGTVVTSGDTAAYEMDVSGWTDIRLP